MARGAVNAVANLIAPFAVYTIGDVKAVLDNPVAADAMRRSVEARVIEMLQDDEIESITIVAHSLGALISYDALTEGRPIDLFLRANPDRRRVPGSREWRRITWVTVGSATNRGYSMTRQPAGAHAADRFRSPIAESIRHPAGGEQDALSAFFWLNVFARYDWVPAGGLDPGLFEATAVDCRQFKERIVINVDRPISDHHSYWDNHEMVWPRIVRAICGGEYPWPRTALGDEESQRLIRGRTERIADRNLRLLAVLGIWLVPVALIWVAVIVAVAVAGWGLFVLWTVYRLVSTLVFHLLVYAPLTALRRTVGWLTKR